MITRIVVAAGVAAIALHAQTRPPAGAVLPPSHASEPIVMRDGSLKIDIYSFLSTRAVSIEAQDTIVVGGAPTNKGTFFVPTGVGKAGRDAGKLQMAQHTAHESEVTQRYTFAVQQIQKSGFVAYTNLVFQFASSSWRIAPSGSNPLTLLGCGASVALTGAWKNHSVSTCEYGFRDLDLRVGSVIIESNGTTTRIDLGTGCSEFLIEPSTHPPHLMPPDPPACNGLTFDPTASYPKVPVGGVPPVTAIDVSLAKLKSKTK